MNDDIPVYPPSLLCDFYKVSHKDQYPEGTEYVYSTWIPRASKIDGVHEVVAFGFQAFIKEWLIDYFDEHFFDRPAHKVCDEYERYMRFALGVENPDSSHIEALHKLGYLPLLICAVPEGTLVPLRVPMLTIENTDPRFFWLTNFIETLFSCEVWQASTSATIALEYRKVLNRYARLTGGDMDFVPFQGHDFSMRGMTSVQSAARSGAGHLLSFVGTDTIPAIGFLERYYGANIEQELVGTSIPATEHSVMCAGGGGEDERKTIHRLLTEVYPSGMFSAVMDTWDLWNVLTNTLPSLKEEIMARDGKLVIRPDSGDPADIICGIPPMSDYSKRPYETLSESEKKGVVELLWDAFGGTVNEKGFRVLDPHVGCIYGDSITLARAEDISARLMAKGFASTNVVYGIGSYTYQYVTRDTFGFALKSTQVTINGEERPIFKDPVTDTDKVKKSLTGRVVVVPTPDGQGLRVIDGLTTKQQASYEGVNLLRYVFRPLTAVTGYARGSEKLSEIRQRLMDHIEIREPLD